VTQQGKYGPSLEGTFRIAQALETPIQKVFEHQGHG
jgi:DNA-binding XRE family transcriptional regulator